MASRRAKYVIWQSKDGWRWHYKAKNGKKMAESGEAYTTRGHCLDALRTFRAGAAIVPIVEFVRVEHEYRPGFVSAYMEERVL